MSSLGWGRFFNKKKKDGKNGIVSVALSNDGFSLIKLLPNATGLPVLAHAQFCPTRKEERTRELGALAREHKLAGFRCHLVLTGDDYRVLQSTTPEAPAEEMREALRWSVQDMLDFPVTDAEVEYYPMPTGRQTSGGGPVTVVVCETSLVKSYTAMCEAAKLQLEVITTREMCLRNLASRLPENSRGVALIYLGEDSGMVQLQKEGVIYISRRLDFAAHRFANGFDERSVESLALEIQRSLDYYESYFSMPPIGVLVVTPISDNTPSLAESLSHTLGVKARAWDIAELVSSDTPLDGVTQHQCLLAIGAALEEPV